MTKKVVFHVKIPVRKCLYLESQYSTIEYKKAMKFESTSS